MAYLTKSRFKLALSCPTKLYYGTKENNYENTQSDDRFMKALAEGGYQVGELAKFLISDNPVADNISFDALGYEDSLRITRNKRAEGGRVLKSGKVLRVALQVYNSYEIKERF